MSCLLFSFLNIQLAMHPIHYEQGVQRRMVLVVNFFVFLKLLLAHLSRRLIGELIVYEGIRRPSVRPSVRRLSTFSNDISSEAVRPILFIFHI